MTQGASGQDKFSYMNGANAAFIDHLYQQYLADPKAVDSSWVRFFEGYEFATQSGAINDTDSGHDVRIESKVEAFINLYRRMGHRCAHLNPLDPKPEIPADMLPSGHGLGDIDLDKQVKPYNLPFEGAVSFREIYELLQDTYAGRIGADFRDIMNTDAVVWFQHQMESCRNKPALSKEEKLRIHQKLVEAEGFEKFLGDRYLGQKRFSIEGLESFLPLLDFMTKEAASAGVEEVYLGMAHRGRLNTLANFMGKPYELMLKEFEGSDYNTFDIDGDVKYHKGFSSIIEPADGKKVVLYLSPNPSHLEAVNPVVEGFTRARQRLYGDTERKRLLPVLVHGDAAFIGQGIVTETINLSGLESYTTGGTIHIITNNQVGFTTNPYESRSCTYSSDIAKIVRAPVLHVNADDPEAVVWTAKLAVAYRQKYSSDVVIDLVGYRRHGHNETDEPSFTQPHMYRKIKKHKTTLGLYGSVLEQEKVLSAGESEERSKIFRGFLQDCLDRVRHGTADTITETPMELKKSLICPRVVEEDFFKSVNTKVPQSKLEEIVAAITHVPEGFKSHPKVNRLFSNRKKMAQDKGGIDWALAELLAFGTLATEGHHIRLSGQDCQRGTFSQRHAVIKDYETGAHLHLLNQISKDQAKVDIINSSLSEQGVLGFEFGYSVADRDALVMWEAQFGDFSNGAQIIIDQFLAASEAKWKQQSGLVLMLPHGHEGMGPEHSSARPERFLQLCGNLNIQMANVTTPAQIFHLLRRQLLREFRKPLIIMTPKSLLRHPKVVSDYKEFSHGEFNEVLGDKSIGEATKVHRVVFCSGKIFYDLAQGKMDNGVGDEIAIVRLEQMYPFPENQVDDILKKFPNMKEVLWTQEEPSNMGCWTFVRHRIKKIALGIGGNVGFRYCGRKSAGTTAEGSTKSHQKEQQRIIMDALNLNSTACRETGTE